MSTSPADPPSTPSEAAPPATEQPALPPVPEASAAPEALPEAPHDAAPEATSDATPEATEARAEVTPDMGPAACGVRLAELFPALFAPAVAPQPVKPIKLRIQADIQQRAPGVFSRRVLGIFFSRYTTSNAYLKALVHAAHRFDLDGQPAGEIAEEHRSAAAEELARRQAIAAERRAAQQRPPRRDVAPPDGETAPRVPPSPRPQRPPREAPRRDDRRGTGAAPAPRPHHPSPRPPRAHERPQRAPGRPESALPPPAAAPAAMPADPAQRERALLLRSFETSTLSKSNFCALKGLSEASLDAALEQARQERAARPRP